MNTTAERIIQIVTPPSDVVELLVLGCPTDDANLYTQTLRNAAMAIHLSTANTQEELDALLEGGKYDIVLVNCDAEEIDFTTAIRQIRKQSPLAAFILLSDDPSEELFFAAETGAQDIIERYDHARLIYTVHREQQNMITKKELERLQARNAELEQRWKLFLQSSRDAVAYVHEGMHIHANPAYLELFGYQEVDDIEGLPFMDLIAPDDRPKFKPVLRALEKEHTAENLEIECVTNSGDKIPVEMRFAPTTIDGESCTQVIVTDRSRPSDFEQRLEDLSHYDIDTGLFNRNYFQEQLEQRLTQATAEGKRLGLIIFRITNFKEIRANSTDSSVNDVLKETARLLAGTLYDSDLLARYGEHEFVLLCTPDTDAEAVANRLLEQLAEHVFESTPLPHFVAGLAFSDDPPVNSAHDFILRATNAAKSAQANDQPLTLFTEELPQSSALQAGVDEELVQLIDRALEKSELFVPAYQPVVSLHGNSREDYSVYLRLRDDRNDRLLWPDQFIPEALKTERMAEIDRWVIRNSIRELAEHRKQGQRLNFFINLSSAAIADDSLLLWVCDCLREFKAKGAWLTFVVAQNDVMANLEQMEQLASGLHQINCRIALSHFTFEQESINLVKHLSIDLVYFETDTAANIAKDKDQRELLNKYNEQLQQDGVKTIVTHIEEAAQLALLWNIGVNYIQGNFIQEPVDSIIYDAEL